MQGYGAVPRKEPRVRNRARYRTSGVGPTVGFAQVERVREMRVRCSEWRRGKERRAGVPAGGDGVMEREGKEGT